MKPVAFSFKLILTGWSGCILQLFSYINTLHKATELHEMTAANLGTKRQCPKCAAKFYDFGATNPITCPKCAKTWKEEAPSKSKVIKPKKEKAAPVKKAAIAAEFEDDVPSDLPDVEDDGIEDLEPMEDEEVEMTSLEEVEEHDEGDEIDPNSDDADDEMFTEMVGEEKLVDDLADYIETDEDHEEDEDGEEE